MTLTPLRIAAFQVLFAGVVALGVLVPACNGSNQGGSGCSSNPFQCASGTTCWPTKECPTGQPATSSACRIQFSCLASKTGIPTGAACSLSSGAAECGDGQTCVSFADASAGECRPYCDSSHGCPADQTCTTLTVGDVPGATEQVCVPPPVDIDGSLMIDANMSGSGSGGQPGDASPMFDGPLFGDGAPTQQ